MKTKYGRDLEKRSNPLRAMLWVLRSKGWKSIWQSTGRMRKKEVCLNLTGVICAGHLTTARCAIFFFLPMDVSDKDVVVEELAVVVRSNGYYPACVSGEQGDTLTLMGPSLTRIWAGDSSIRKNEVRRVVAETVPGVGVRIRVVFFHPLAKDSKGTPADNNQPLSVSVNGRLRLK